MKGLGLAAAGALLLAGCGVDTTGTPVEGVDSMGTVSVRLPSGRVAECVTFDSGSYAGGLWCSIEGPG